MDVVSFRDVRCRFLADECADLDVPEVLGAVGAIKSGTSRSALDGVSSVTFGAAFWPMSLPIQTCVASCGLCGASHLTGLGRGDLSATSRLAGASCDEL